jgi:hypothetical protein
MHAGREVNVPDPLPSMEADAPSGSDGFPMPRGTRLPRTDSGCALAFRGAAPDLRWLALGLAAAVVRRRRSLQAARQSRCLAP